MKKTINELMSFLNQAYTPFHVVENIKQRLLPKGYIYLTKNETWNLELGKKYFYINNDNMIIVMHIPNDVTNMEVHIVASHNDSPTFKLKPNFYLDDKNYRRLNTEPYGGAIYASFLDRPLGIAGKVIEKENDIYIPSLVNLNETVIIPNLAIHMNREINSGMNYNPQVDMLPLLSVANQKQLLSEKVISHDLFLYNKDQAILWGTEEEYISAPRLDDLECAFGSIYALEQASHQSLNIAVIFNHEEVGSRSTSGAGANTLETFLKKVIKLLGQEENTEQIFSNSMIVSADNAHAIHPNHPEKSDPTNAPLMNKGIVIKHQAGLAYTTDVVSESIFKALCEMNNVAYQDYTNRSDIRGGSTLGSILLGSLNLASVDIGLAQLAMHSAFETAGTKDFDYLVNGLIAFYNQKLNLKQVLINK